MKNRFHLLNKIKKDLGPFFVTQSFETKSKIISWGTPARFPSSIPPEIPPEKKSNYFQKIPRIIFYIK
jgi:hypothetical protein